MFGMYKVQKCGHSTYAGNVFRSSKSKIIHAVHMLISYSERNRGIINSYTSSPAFSILKKKKNPRRNVIIWKSLPNIVMPKTKNCVFLLLK